MEILYINLKNGNLVNKSKKWAVILEEWQKLGLQCQKKFLVFAYPKDTSTKRYAWSFMEFGRKCHYSRRPALF